MRKTIKVKRKPFSIFGKCLLLFICCNTLLIKLHAQYNIKENNVWAFGYRTGLNFNNGNPLPVQTGIKGTIPPPYPGWWLEGCASVCDTNGNLLFYCTPDSIWNKNGQVMPNGDRLMPYINSLGHDSSYFGYSTTQGSLIMPVINIPGRYYVFSLEQSEDFTENGDSNACRLFYCIVDMSLDSGLGDVMPSRKGIKLDSALSEKMTAVAGNNCDLWLLVHSRDTNIFKAYHLDGNGLDTIPVISQVGNLPVYGINPSFGEGYIAGVMKCSPDRTKIVLCNLGGFTSDNDGVELYSFDPGTGQIVSSIGTINAGSTYNGQPNTPYGACFSADNSKLYIQNFHSIYQYDLSVFSITNIINSAYLIDSSGDYNGTDMRLGPDAKIFFNNQTSKDSISVIAKPNLGGVACNFMPDAIGLLPGDSVFFGLPQMYIRPCDTEQVAVRSPQLMHTEVSLWPNPNNGSFCVSGVINNSNAVAIEIRNMVGELVYKDELAITNNNFQKDINLKTANGLYFLRLRDSNGRNYSYKFVIDN